MSEVATFLCWVGVALYFAAYIWAFVLASRVSAGWFLGMLFLGWLLYPFFAWKNWPLLRRNAMALVGGIVLVVMGLTLKAMP